MFGEMVWGYRVLGAAVKAINWYHHGNNPHICWDIRPPLTWPRQVIASRRYKYRSFSKCCRQSSQPSSSISSMDWLKRKWTGTPIFYGKSLNISFQPYIFRSIHRILSFPQARVHNFLDWSNIRIDHCVEGFGAYRFDAFCIEIWQNSRFYCRSLYLLQLLFKRFQFCAQLLSFPSLHLQGMVEPPFSHQCVNAGPHLRKQHGNFSNWGTPTLSNKCRYVDVRTIELQCRNWVPSILRNPHILHRCMGSVQDATLLHRDAPWIKIIRDIG